MAMNAIAPATPDVGDGVVVSFGSGDTSGSGRLGRRVDRAGNTATARRQNASSAEVRSVRSQINRSTAVSARRRRQLIQEIQDNSNRRGNIRRSILRDILDAALGRD